MVNETDTTPRHLVEASESMVERVSMMAPSLDARRTFGGDPTEVTVNALTLTAILTQVWTGDVDAARRIAEEGFG